MSKEKELNNINSLLRLQRGRIIRERKERSIKMVNGLQQQLIDEMIDKLAKETRALEKCIRTVKKYEKEIENINNRMKYIYSGAIKFNIQHKALEHQGLSEEDIFVQLRGFYKNEIIGRMEDKNG
tara:strand:+ start:404 stop:778 length:375 start_codon:yes stop_codon:yes gene_type:complete